MNSINSLLPLINDPKAKENLFIRKWQLISQKNKSKKWKDDTLALQADAKALGNVETVRDCDFHLAEFDSALSEKIFFGTPYETFRKKILQELRFTPPNEYWLDLNPYSENIKVEFDYSNFKTLKVGSVIFKVIQALTFDFYRAQNMYTLFELIFPNDYLNPESSFNKVHQALKRIRDWIEKNNLSLKIVQQDEEYFLQGEVRIKIYLRDRLKGVSERMDEGFYSELDALKKHFRRNFFSMADAVLFSQHANVRKMQRFMKIAIEHNYVIKSGLGKKTIYQFNL